NQVWLRNFRLLAPIRSFSSFGSAVRVWLLAGLLRPVLRWCHELGTDRLAHRLRNHFVDVGAGLFVELPAHRVAPRRELLRMARAPERDRNARCVEDPADREREHALLVAIVRESIEQLHCGEVLREPWRLKLRIGVAEVVALELRALVDGTAQKAAA